MLAVSIAPVLAYEEPMGGSTLSMTRVIKIELMPIGAIRTQLMSTRNTIRFTTSTKFFLLSDDLLEHFNHAYHAR